MLGLPDVKKFDAMNRYSEEQRLLADSARDFLAARSPVAAQRRLRDEGSVLGFDPQLWQAAVDLGWSAIPFPENYGGLDFGRTFVVIPL